MKAEWTIINIKVNLFYFIYFFFISFILWYKFVEGFVTLFTFHSLSLTLFACLCLCLLGSLLSCALHNPNLWPRLWVDISQIKYEKAFVMLEMQKPDLIYWWLGNLFKGIYKGNLFFLSLRICFKWAHKYMMRIYYEKKIPDAFFNVIKIFSGSWIYFLNIFIGIYIYLPYRYISFFK